MFSDDNEGFSRHISRQFNQELENIRTQMLAMGGVVERQVSDAVEALVSNNSALAEQALRSDKQTNAMELSIDEQCTRMIAIRQPTASDLRLIMSVTRSVHELERIGDEASRICRQALLMINDTPAPVGYREVRHIGNLVNTMLQSVLTAFARADLQIACRVAAEDNAVDKEYREALDSLASHMRQYPDAIPALLNMMWVLRSLERIGDHARNLSEHLIYQVSGKDVRHQSLSEIEATLQRE